MRLRDETLKTGKALAWIDPEGRSKPRVLLFLVQGAADIEVLGKIESVCGAWIEERAYEGFEWHAVADPGQISLVDNRLFSADVRRFEACEFHSLDDRQLRVLLVPVINHIVNGDPELLPRAGGAVGGPAEGIQFLNREAEIQDLSATIRSGGSLFLHAPRRMGKTSLMRRLQSKLSGEYETLQVNFERDQTPVEIAARFKSTLTGEPFRGAIRTAQADPARILEDSIEALCQRPGKTLLLFIDELVVLFQSIRRTQSGEASQRSEALRYLSAIGVPLERHAARLVVAGSVDWLDYLHSQFGVVDAELPGLFSRLVRTPIRPLDFQHPECELRRVLLGSALVPEPEDLAWLYEHVDLTVPFPALRFLDVLAGEVQRGVALGPQDFDRLLRGFLAETECFDDFEEHLRHKCPDVSQAELVADALDILSQEPFSLGVGEEQINAVLLRAGPSADLLRSWLMDTFPVTLKDQRVRFVSRLFRHWWRFQMHDQETQHE